MAVLDDIRDPVDLLKRKLAGLLQNGKNAPAQPGQPTPQGPPTGADQSGQYQRDPDSGLLRRGASTQQTAQAPSYMQTDVTDQNKPTAPTITPSTPQGAPKPAPTGTAAAPKPYLSDEQWAAQNPGAVPPLVPYQPGSAIQPPTTRSRLLHTLEYGALAGVKPALAYNEGITNQERTAKLATQNAPQTLHEARMKDEAARAAVGKTEAETENQRAEAQARLAPPQKPAPATPIEQIQADYVKQSEAGDTAQADKSLDMLTRLQTALHPELAGASKDAFQLYMKGHPGATYEEWMAASQKAAAETTKIKPEVESQIGPQPQREHFQQGPIGDAAFTAANKAWGVAAEKIENDMANASQQTRGEAFGKNRPVQVIDVWNGNRPVIVSAGEAEDNPSRYMTQSGATNALPKQALIQDIRTSAENVEKNLKVLDEKGFDRASLAAALANPATTFEAYLQAIPRGALNDNEQQFVADMFNLREQAMAMRTVLGAGAGSEDMRAAILNTLPGVASGGAGFGEKQIKNLTQVLDRLERGVLGVPLAGGQNDQTKKPAGVAAKEPPVGTVEDGYKLVRAGAGDPKNWEKVPTPAK